MRNWVILVALAGLGGWIFTAATGFFEPEPQELKSSKPAWVNGPCPRWPTEAVQPTEVVRVIDGDTVEIDPAVEGMDTVRMIGIDTPESVDPDGPVEKGGPVASRFTKDMLQGKTVYLEMDAETEDDYGRLLAYVWTKRGLYEELLLANGMAAPLTIAPNDRYADCLEALG